MREIALGAVLSIVVAATGLLIAAWPVSGRPVAVFFPRGISAAQAMAAIQSAGGHVLQIGATPSLVIGVSARADFTADLYRSGAWLVTSATIAKLCVTSAGGAGA